MYKNVASLMKNKHEPVNVVHVPPIKPYNAEWLETYINEPAIGSQIRQIQYTASIISGNNRIAWLLRAIGFIDLTSLNSYDTTAVMEHLCNKAVQPLRLSNLSFDWNEPIHTAAVCVYPTKVREVINILKDLNNKAVKVATVGAGFPSGQCPMNSRKVEVSCAIEYGAQEIDIVIDRTLALDHKWEQLYDEILTIRKICDEKAKKICLKVILSTGELYNLTDVYKTAMVAMMAGADFIKTSTGKEAVNATFPVGVVMCRAILEFERLTSRKVGFKPAGGIKIVKEALEWITLVKEILGDTWLNETYFRIGASSLLDDIVKELEKSKCEKEEETLTNEFDE